MKRHDPELIVFETRNVTPTSYEPPELEVGKDGGKTGVAPYDEEEIVPSNSPPELEALAAARAELQPLVEALPEPALDWRGGDELWTPRLVLGHLAHGHDFYVMILEGARAAGFGELQLPPNQPGWARMGETDDEVDVAGSVAEVWAIFEQRYDRLVRLLGELSPEELDRPFVFQGWRAGQETITTTLRQRVIAAAAEHIREHLDHLANLTNGWRAASAAGTQDVAAPPPRSDLRGQIARRLQRYLLTKYAGHEIVTLPAFALCFSHGDPAIEASVALPRVFELDALVADLPRVRQAFAERGRRAAVELVDAALPGLPYRLEQAGFELHQVHPILICTPELLHQPEPLPDTTLVVLSQRSSIEEIQEGLDANALGFDPEAPPSDTAEAEQFRATLNTSRAFTLRHQGQAVAAGMFLELEDGVTEITGLTTLAAFRGRGFASYLTGRIAEAAFAGGADVVFLVPASGEASRAYERAGFTHAGRLCVCHDGLHTA